MHPEILKVYQSEKLRALCRGLIKSPEWEDVFHDSIEKLLNLPSEKICKIVKNKALNSYAYLTVKNTSLDFLIKKNKGKNITTLPENLKDENKTDLSALKELEGNLEKVYWYYRELLNLYVEHKSYRKIEKITGIPYKSVSYGIKKGQELLKKEMR